MKRTPLWISAAFVVLLLTLTLFWNFSMRAASRPGPGKKGHAAANNHAIENFDIRDRESQEAMLKFERRMEKLSSMRKENSANLKFSSNAFEVHNTGEIWCSALWEVDAQRRRETFVPRHRRRQRRAGRERSVRLAGDRPERGDHPESDVRSDNPERRKYSSPASIRQSSDKL